MPARIVAESESACTRCSLAQTRAQVVVGRGSGEAAVMFVGEAPGRQEDQSGLGFQGAAGQRFNDMLAFLGLSRDDIWLANAVRCRPSVEGRRNRAPKPIEIQACRHWLVQDIGKIKPSVIVTLGRVAFEALTGRDWDASVHATPLAVPEFGVQAFALYHPAYLIYRRELYPLYRHDLAALRTLLTARGIFLRPSSGSWE